MGNENMEGGQAAGTVGQPNQSASAANGDQQLSSVDVKTLESLVKDLAGQVRALQSDKDRGVHKLDQKLNSLTETIKQYEKYRGKYEPDEAQWRMQVDALLAQGQGIPQADVPSAGGGGTPTQAAGVDTATLVKAVGLDANSPEVLAAIRDHQDNLFEQYAAITNLAVKRQAAQQTPPNSAQIMSAGGGQPVPSVTVDSLTAEYQNLTKNIPPGEEGVRARLDAKIAIRKKAAEAQLQSPV